MRVCVVGAGASGLPAIKSCVEEGLEVVCFEKTSQVGGLWNYRPGQKNIGATVMESTVVNTSKEMMAYSDFPPPEHYANFMHHTKVNEYIQNYAKRFNLLDKIRFNTTVKRISRRDGKYIVELESGDVEQFDKLMLCTGHHAQPSYPNLSTIGTFKGKVMHAYNYTNTKGFEGKNVFLLGIGNSALDIAVDLAKIAKSVTISTRRGTWIFNRVSNGGMPYDVQLFSRYYDNLLKAVPWTLANDFMEHRLQQRMDHDLYGLRPNHRFFQQHPTVNDTLANLICAGYITITEDVETFTESGVIVKNGKEFACDVFVNCTGYTFGFPFVDKDIIDIKNQEVPLYKFVFPPENDTLAVIGLIQPIGSIAPISEIQSRWAARVFSGKLDLPTTELMIADIAKKKAEMKRRYFESIKHTIQVDYMTYMDEIAEIIGCLPPMAKYFISYPRFWMKLFMGPNVPYVYRLVGPNAWDGAEQAIWTVTDRVKKPLKNRQCRIRRHKKRGTTDEYFRYASQKWIATTLSVLFVAGFLTYCWASASIPPAVYFASFVLFFVLYGSTLLWFDLQYDMTTIF
ncbi:unnamed protein product [Caenorhabditis bovis]|uniref:Flavin-containing monooxygenase n=1 Tax=Caenorhabditis bovis TaxID=2654633 RepID=A0A8S1EEU7_9PELO|nr:unnamed protein product [Caenorhabditis bovis]